MRPALLVRSGGGTPTWISPLECLKLAVGSSTFKCCETNHTVIETCQKSVARSSLNKMVRARAVALFHVNEFALARFHKALRVWWLRGLQTENQAKLTLTSFRKILQWNNDIDGEWFDRCEISILMYAVVSNNDIVLLELLRILGLQEQSSRIRAKRLQGRLPIHGVSEIGLPGGLTTLVAAMAFASTRVVQLLLEHDADPFESTSNGNDPFMGAAVFGRPENAKFWLEQFPDWDLERRNTVVGGVALGHAVYMGPHRLELVKVLLEHGACLDYRTDTGGSVLTALCENEDAEPEVLELILRTKMRTSVNYRVYGRTTKWQIIYRLTLFLNRNKLTKSGVMNAIAEWSGSSALHSAVQRGDVDIVNLLLEHGADPRIKNDLGKSPVDYCDAFPEMRGALKRVIQQKKEGKQVTLHRRISTATDMKFPMYLVPLDQLERLYGGTEPRYDRIEAHQDLLRRGELVRWIDLPFDAHIIFLSHE